MTVIVHSPLGGGGERPHPPTALSRHPGPAEIQQLLATPLHHCGKGVLEYAIHETGTETE